MKNSLSHRDAILWAIVSSYNSSNFKSFSSNVKKDALVKELITLHAHQHSLNRETWLTLSLIVHFTVVCFGTWPLSGSEAGGDLVLIQTSCFSYVNAN